MLVKPRMCPLSLSFDNLSANANQYNWFVNSVQISSDNDCLILLVRGLIM